MTVEQLLEPGWVSRLRLRYEEIYPGCNICWGLGAVVDWLEWSCESAVRQVLSIKWNESMKRGLTLECGCEVRPGIAASRAEV